MQERQQEIKRDLGGHPTADEQASIMQAEALYNVSITMLGSGWVKLTADKSMIDEAVKHLTSVMAEKHIVRWPSHWAPQQGLVQLFNVDKASSEGAAIVAEMSSYNIVKVRNQNFCAHNTLHS